MLKIGKKTKEWIKDRAKRIKESVIEGRISINNGFPEGVCSDCGHWHKLDPDHIKKRSQGGSNEKENIEWVCNSFNCRCHDKRDNQGDPMDKKIKNKKPAWAIPHYCKNCHQRVQTFLCSNCKKPSI